MVQTSFPKQTRIQSDGNKLNQLPEERFLTVTPRTIALDNTSTLVPAPPNTVVLTTATCTLPSPLLSNEHDLPPLVARTPSLKPDPPLGMTKVSLLLLCDPRVTICHGCGQLIRGAGAFLLPLADLAVVTKMRCDYSVAGEKRQGKLGTPA